MDLRYHSEAWSLIGSPPRISEENARLLSERQKALGVVVPASFVEWYSIDGALEFLARIFDEESLSSEDWSSEAMEVGRLILPGCSSQAGFHFVRLNDGDDPPVRGEDWDGETVGEGDATSLSQFMLRLVRDQLEYEANG